MHLHMFVYNGNPWNVETPVFYKADRVFCPTSTWTVQVHLIMLTLACLSCLSSLVDSTTGLQNITSTHSISISHQCTARVSSGMRLSGIQQHEYTLPCLPQYTGSLQTTGTSTFLTGSSGPYNVHIRGAPLYSTRKPPPFSAKCATFTRLNR